MKVCFGLLIFIFSYFSLVSQPVVWNFNNETNSVSEVSANVTASNATFGPGLLTPAPSFETGSSGTGFSYNAQKWSQGGLDAGDYIEFCITNESAATFDVLKFDFEERRDLDGPLKYIVKYSIDGGTEQNLGVEMNIEDNTDWRSRSHVPIVGLTVGIGSQICFKIYGYNAEKNVNNWAFDNVRIEGTGAIPIQLLDFNAQIVDETTQLNWSTATESNNDYFLLEWSRDRVNFEELTKIDGAGTSREIQKYNFTHINNQNGLFYYRLSQIDFDGKVEMYDVVSISKKLDNNYEIKSNFDFNTIEIEFDNVGEKNELQIYNLEGRLLHKYILSKGQNNLKMNISNFKPGMYISLFINETEAIAKKFIKQ